MALADVCVHVATPVSVTQNEGAGEWVEGEFEPSTPTPGTPFDCCLFLPQGEEPGGPASRGIRRPTLLFLPEDHAGAPTVVTREMELDIVAPELNATRGLAADAAVRWQVDGDPQPFGKPGDDVMGYQARLERVDE